MTEHSEPKPYDVEQPVAAGRDEVWDAVTQPPVLRQWFGWDHDGLDHEIQQIFVDEATLTSPERMGWPDSSFLEVTGDDDRSTVRAVRIGDPAADPVAFDAMEEGWRVFLAQLRFLLEERPEGLRRTVHLTGSARGRGVLALADGEALPLGTRTAQVMTADGQLVLVSGHEPLDSPEAGRIEVVVSTFGLGDDAFAEVRDDWTQRWAALAREAVVTVA
ncbi:activator of Hsp90 ATPase 1 family protein [Actinoplanes friuliensis]|uniref:Activator of Hsp90 ATPase 1 family protein n=1 Tax=Actinoplanes friuliensis DSM 7358 TaxID=1246995 RepID=U5VUU7_9ACTN|nr:activator of Hsp90 ATPase 1 family protein [Actinoplanes friuliensis]AGZ39510.1 activator of Hsp90 ATPase 1 family protein [Actinoplanes friuliensis DSM 7358]